MRVIYGIFRGFFFINSKLIHLIDWFFGINKRNNFTTFQVPTVPTITQQSKLYKIIIFVTFISIHGIIVVVDVYLICSISFIVRIPHLKR